MTSKNFLRAVWALPLIVLCQAAMMVTLVVLSRVDFSRHFELLIALVLVHNVFAATNDIAIDSLAVNSLQEHERGTANGFMFGGAYLGQALGGGGAMFVAPRDLHLEYN